MSEALFDVPADQVRRPRRTPPGRSKPKWGAYRPVKPMKCDDCMAVLAAADGHAPAARIARWKRVQDGKDQLLCGGHMEQRRHDEGLEPLKNDRKDRLL